MKKNRPIKDLILTREFLEQLDPAELADLVELAEETEKQNSPDLVYVENPVQAKFHRSQAFIRALFSGNGVGKTTACINEAIWTSLGTHPYRPTSRIPNTTIIVLDDPAKADTVYLSQLKKKRWYDPNNLEKLKHGRSHTVEIIFPNGSNWVFMTHEMLEDKWESIECAAVIFDEPPPRFIYIALLRGMREKDMKPWIAFAGTPRGRNSPWMYREIYRPWKFAQDPDIECFFGTTFDNLMNLDPETIERWKKRYTEQELKTRVYGEFEFLSGRIFDTFFRDHHVEESFVWPKSWPVILAMDPHLRKNHVAVLLGIDRDKEIHVIRELETSLAGKKAAEFFIRACEPYSVKAGICDNFGSIKMYEGKGKEKRKSFIDLFNDTSREMGSKVRIRPTTNKEKKDDEWIEDMRDWLRVEADRSGQERGRFHIFEDCIKTIDNFESYVWDEHRGAAADGKDIKEEPLGTDCDYLMCVKYGISIKPDKLGEDKIFSGKLRRRYANSPREYESDGKPRPWSKD